MTAFRHREHYTTGAGECVSLAALYAAAMFIVGEVPLEKIFMMATPLHSQNFIDEKEGLLTNNRRIMTKNMWFNGTSLSGKARRALENEKVTIVSHITGHIHTNVLEQRGQTIFLNPGSPALSNREDKRQTIALLEDAEIRIIDIQTDEVLMRLAVKDRT